jgi:hypothetical protein
MMKRLSNNNNTSRIVDNLAWVSWEAARFLGGYTTLLANLTASPVYQQHVGKTILMGPLYMPLDCDLYDPLETPRSIADRLNCTTLYSPRQKPSDIVVHPALAYNLREIERRYNVEIFYLKDKGTTSHEVERILINFSACITPSYTYSRTLPIFLRKFKEKVGVEFLRHEKITQHSAFWDAIYAAKSWSGINPSDNIVENFRRKTLCDTNMQRYDHPDNNSLYGALLAEPATEALQTILGQNQTCVFFAQDTLSLPMAYNINQIREWIGKRNIKTVYYAGDIDPIRNLIDGYVLPNVQLDSEGGFDWEGPIRKLISRSIENSPSRKKHLLEIPALLHIQTHGNMRLIQHGWKLDMVTAISDNVVDEFMFVDPGFSNLTNIPICYPGIATVPCTIESKERARKLLLSYAWTEWGFDLDTSTTLMAVHTARAVRAKGFSRDISIIKALGQQLLADGIGILLIIVTAWKGKEGDLIRSLISASEDINSSLPNVRLKVINEFHWPDRAEPGSYPTNLSREDLHQATDISLGLSTYDTFAISPLEPMSCGAICVISTGCGCARRVQKLEGYESNIVIADYANGLNEILGGDDDEKTILEITYQQKRNIEDKAAETFAAKLAEKVPRNKKQRADAQERGTMLAKQMNWDDEITRSFIPVLEDLFERRSNY